jgi:hypothetical protein
MRRASSEAKIANAATKLPSFVKHASHAVARAKYRISWAAAYQTENP